MHYRIAANEQTVTALTTDCYAERETEQRIIMKKACSLRATAHNYFPTVDLRHNILQIIVPSNQSRPSTMIETGRLVHQNMSSSLLLETAGLTDTVRSMSNDSIGERSTTTVEGRSGGLKQKAALHLESPPNESIEAEPKSVSFSRNVRVRKISKHTRYSEEERSRMWFSAEEFQEIRKGAVKTVKKMMKNKPVDDDPNDCTRGLEFKTPKQNKIRQERKADVTMAVLEEQLKNEDRCYEKASRAISETYISCNRGSIFEAHRRGIMDAIAAWGEPAHNKFDL